MAKYGLCDNCGIGTVVENHHIFNGANRNISDKYDYMQVYLCYDCHRKQPTGIHGGNRKLDLKYRKQAQKEFEKNHTREEFIKLIGRNYL